MATAQRQSGLVWDLMVGVVLVLGLWLAASPYVIPDASLYDASRLTATFFGGSIVMFAIAELALSPGLRWVGLVDVPLGLWVAVTPFVAGETALSSLVANMVIVGLATALLSLVSVIAGRR